MENRIKKDIYNASPIDLRTKVKLGEEEEIAIKPYYYIRNNALHIKYSVDRCIKLTSAESTRLKLELTSSSQDKQEILAKAWNFFVNFVRKTVIRDGVAYADSIVKEGKKDGQQN